MLKRIDGTPDGRSLRAKGRTVQLATRVTPEVKAKIDEIHFATGLGHSDIIEALIMGRKVERVKS